MAAYGFGRDPSIQVGEAANGWCSAVRLEKPSGGWQVGFYQLSVYDMGDNWQLPGCDSYHVTNVRVGESDGSVIGPDSDVIQDLVVSGPAVRKQ